MPNDYRFRYDWFSGNVPTWRVHLGSLAERTNVTAIEIGSWEGRSAVWLLENILKHPSCVLHCIDTWASPNGSAIEAAFDHNVSLASQVTRARLIKHKGPSSEILPTLEPASADLIYVDGAHTAKDVLSDAVLSWRLLRPGGIVIFDDYELTQGIEFFDGYETFPVVPPLERPKLGIDSFLACFEGEYRLLHKDWQVILAKEGAGDRQSPPGA